MKNIYIKTHIHSGANALKSLETIKSSRVWVISDQFLVKNESIRMILAHLDNSNYVSIFSEVVPEPPVELIGKGIAILGKVRPDVVIAFGGGSAIDTAKGILYFARLSKLAGDVRLIAVPTTSGTGSEVTSATVISDREEKRKYPIFSDTMLPDEAILDPALTCSVPPIITANTGMDVLTHAIEAYAAKNANAYSDSLAEKSVELVNESLLKCYQDGNDIESRGKMQEASNLAGIAFNLAGLGMNHSIAHQIGGVFHIAHGLANALLLNHIIRINSRDTICLARYAKLARKTGLAGHAANNQQAVTKLTQMIDSLIISMDMPVSLKACGVNQSELIKNSDEMAENAIRDECSALAPRLFSLADIRKILINLYEPMPLC